VKKPNAFWINSLLTGLAALIICVAWIVNLFRPIFFKDYYGTTPHGVAITFGVFLPLIFIGVIIGAIGLNRHLTYLRINGLSTSKNLEFCLPFVFSIPVILSTFAVLLAVVASIIAIYGQ